VCKINGHSLFTYLVQPVWNAPKLFNSKKRAEAAQTAEEKAAETIKNNTEGDEVSKTASVAQVNKPNKNQSLSSLRVPLENSVGASLGGTQALGLNLGG
jgi:hypothetical protein